MLINLTEIFGITLIVVALFMTGLKLKQIIKPGSDEIVELCALEKGELNEDDACTKCEIKDLINCPENKLTVRKNFERNQKENP